MIDYVTYLLTLCLLFATVLKTAEYSARHALPPFLTSSIVAACAIYVSCIIPGALGLLRIPVVYGTFCVVCAAILLGIRRLGATSRVQGGESRPEALWQIEQADLVLVGAALLFATPLLDYFRTRLPDLIRNPDATLGWDVVSYHLPGVIEFWRNHTLWSFEGPYQSYSFAYELIGTFLAYPFRAHWGVVLSDLCATTMMLAAIVFLTRALGSSIGPQQAARTLPTAALAAVFWAAVHHDSIGDAGKNDIFMAACLTAGLGYLVHATQQAQQQASRSAVILACLAAGLALGTKPSALAFVPFFVIGSGVVALADAADRKRWRRAAIGAGMAIVTILGLGGFWLARNLLEYGALSPLPGAWNLSLIANIANPALYEVNRGSLLFGVGLLAAPINIYLMLKQHRSSGPILPLLALTAFHLVACVAFAITPHAIFHHNLTDSLWKLRLGMPVFASAAVSVALFIQHIGLSIRSGEGSLRLRARPVLTALCFLSLAALPIHWHNRGPSIMSGYEAVRGLPPTAIYSWIAVRPMPLRIYAAGVRPYGVLGPTWENRVFYDGHSTLLEPLADGIIRIAAVVTQFDPDLVIISVDPHYYSESNEKPEVTSWILERSDCFELVFSDRAVSAFRVLPEAAERLRGLVPHDYVARMGG